jgi:hypothetical protein
VLFFFGYHAISLEFYYPQELSGIDGTAGEVPVSVQVIKNPFFTIVRFSLVSARM